MSNNERESYLNLSAALSEVERLARYLDGLAPGDKHYAKLIREAVNKGLS